MAEEKGISGFGSTLKHGDTAEVANAVAKVVKITAPKKTVKTSSYTSMDDRTSVKVPGTIEIADCTIELIYTKTQQAALYAIIGVEKYWKIETADGSTITFQGFITDVGQEIPHDGHITGSASIAVTSDPVFTPGA